MTKRIAFRVFLLGKIIWGSSGKWAKKYGEFRVLDY
jgi:hypothetical protein